MTVMIGNHPCWPAARLAVALLAPLPGLVAAGAAAQSNTQTIQRTLDNLSPLPPPSEPYQRSREDQLQREQRRGQALGEQGRATQSQQQLIDRSGRQLQQDLQAQRQRDIQLLQQYDAYKLQSLQMRQPPH